MESEERIRKLVVLGDSQLSQGLPGKARDSYAKALELVRSAGSASPLSALVEGRLADLDAQESPG